MLYSKEAGKQMSKGGIGLATGTKEALASALRQMMTVKPIDKVTVKDIVEICGVNRQTFYYHFDDVDDLLEWVFEQDSDRVFPREVVYNHWMEDMMGYFDYLVSNSAFTLNVYNSNSRLYMLRYRKGKTSTGRTLSSWWSSMPTAPSASSHSGWIWGCSSRRRLQERESSG